MNNWSTPKVQETTATNLSVRKEKPKSRKLSLFILVVSLLRGQNFVFWAEVWQHYFICFETKIWDQKLFELKIR